jgi:hypothetical protein
MKDFNKQQCYGVLKASRSWLEGVCTFSVHHDDSLYSFLALKSLQCFLHLCLSEKKTKTKRWQIGWMNLPIPQADESYIYLPTTNKEHQILGTVIKFPRPVWSGP